MSRKQFFPNHEKLPFKIGKTNARSDNVSTTIDLDVNRGNLTFTKSITNCDQYEPAKLENLLELYAILQNQKIRHTYNPFEFHQNEETIEFTTDVYSEANVGIKEEKDIIAVIDNVSLINSI
jgi:hypothetical protein